MNQGYAPAAVRRRGVVRPGTGTPPWEETGWGWRVADAGVGGGLLASGVGVVLLLARGSPADQGAMLVVLGAGLLLLLWGFRLLVEPADAAFVGRLLIAGVLLRVGLTLAFHYTLPVGFFAPDQFTFQDVGWRTLRHLQGVGPRPWQIDGTYEVAWFYWNALLYRIFGFVPLAPKMINALLGAWAGLAAYRLGAEVGGRAGANLGALLVLLMPSLILWSTQNLREAPVTLLTTVFLILAVRLHSRRGPSALGGLLLVLGLLGVLRDYMAWMAGLALVGSLLLSSGRSAGPRVLAVAVIGVVWVGAYHFLGFGNELLSTANFEALNAQRQALASGGTAFAPDVDISTPTGGLVFLPLGTVFFLFAPFPWQAASSPLAAMAFPETLLWYGLFLYAIIGAFHVLRAHFDRAVHLVTFLILTTAVYGLVEGNAGTAYRHRSQLIVGLLIFAAIGIELRRTQRAGAAGDG